jgi:hypothetical protein
MFRAHGIVRALAWVPIVAAVLATTAQAGARDHDGGFFLRLSAGGGPARTEFNEGTESMELSGFGFDFNMAIGGMVAQNLALHGTLGGWTVSNPDAEGATFLVGPFSGEFEGDVTMSMFGGGLTYYFMPINIYVSGSVGAATLSSDSPAGEGETDMGPAFDLTVGKEWWVGNKWGLGLAVAFGYHSLPEKDSSENWSGTSFTVRFSATLN